MVSEHLIHLMQRLRKKSLPNALFVLVVVFRRSGFLDGIPSVFGATFVYPYPDASVTIVATAVLPL